MEWTGAGALFTSRFNGKDMMLIARETRDGCWGDIGGLKTSQEAAVATAVRRVSQETGGAFGSINNVRELLHSPAERLSVGTYRMLICSIAESDFTRGIPDRLHSVETSDEGNHSLERLRWIATEQVYEAVIKSIINNDSTVSVYGRTLRSRLVEALKLSRGFQYYIRKQHPEVPVRPLDITRLRNIKTTLRDPNDPKKGVVPLVTINDINGKPSKVFAVMNSKGSHNELIAEDRSFYRPDLSKSLLQRCDHFFRRIFGFKPVLANESERLLIWQGMQGEGVFAPCGRFYQNLLCRLGHTPTSLLPTPVAGA